MDKNTIKTSNSNIEIYENEIYILCDEYIAGLRDPDEIYSNKRLVTEMCKYIYKHYVSNVLNNKYSNGNRYNDFILLDKLWDIFTSIVHKYNTNSSILLFTCFSGISRETINTWKNNHDRQLTQQQSDIVKKWFKESELDLVSGGSVFDIFMLKSNFNYNDNLQAIPLESQGRTATIESLPTLAIDSNPE